MWDAASQVSSIFGLLAFLLAGAVAVWRARLARRVELIETAPEPERIEMTQTVLDGVAIDTGNLTRAQRYELARDVLRRRADRFRWALIGALSLGVLAAGFAAYAFTIVHRPAAAPELHRLRIAVVEADGEPVAPSAATVAISIGGEVKQTSSGWEVDVAEASLPADRRLVVRGEHDGRRGSAEVEVPPKASVIPVTVQLDPPLEAVAHGLVVDAENRAVAGARVSLVGRQGSAAVTGPDGAFTLPAGAPAGEEVRLRIEHPDHPSVEQYHLLGGQPVSVVLEGGRSP